MKASLSLPIIIWFSGISSLRSQTTLPSETLSRSNKGISFGAKITETGNLFNPKMDYDEWTPLGRGDPLKNDPTYDYVPPVLERVHYWMDPSKRTPDPPLPNSGVLVLGSRTESTFTSRPTTTRYQPFQSKESQADSRIDTSSLLDPFFKLMDVPQFGLHFNSNGYKQTTSRIQRPQYQSNRQKTQPPQALQRPPYTMLMPPPPPSHPPTGHSTTTTIALPETTKNATTINPTVLANTENVFKPVAISMPGQVELAKAPGSKKPPEEPATTPATTTIMKQEIKPPIPNSNHLHHATTAKYKPAKNSFRYAEEHPAGKKGIETGLRNKRPEGKGTMDHRVDYPSLRATTAPSTTPAGTTTEISALTTDPLFKHYKQPSDTGRGPFYLIIQGHSKVKTYGASKNPINSLLTSNEIKHDEEEGKKINRERKAKRLKYEGASQESNNVEDSRKDVSVSLTGEDNLESLEEAFPKSEGGSSKKRYLGSNRRKRFATDDGKPSGGTDKGDNVDLENLIAISDDYDPRDVADILQAPQGSGFGSLSIFARSQERG